MRPSTDVRSSAPIVETAHALGAIGPRAYRLVASVPLPTTAATATRLHLVTDDQGSDQIVVLEHGAASAGHVPLVRVHSACLTGDLFGSLRCDCGVQLSEALSQVCAATWGILVYVCGHEGRGIGLANKIRAYCLQDAGLDTFQANVELGLPEDARDYAGAAATLRLLGAHSIELLSSNPHKAASLRAAGITIHLVREFESEAVPTNARYLEAKRARFASERAEGECLPHPSSGEVGR